ncbi:MAG: DUF4105 domain-containing protein [Pseudomonadota bacterium]
MRKIVLLLIAIGLFQGSARAQSPTLDALAASPSWQRLLHVEDGKSTIHADTFFLAENGRYDPRAELRATIDAMRAASEAGGDDDPRCRFPARYLWLVGQEVSLPPRPACPAFDDWVYGAETESISIVFATGYLGNPASFYGHTLLKFNADENVSRSDLLDVTVNYGAVIPPGTGPLEYIVKGAVGGFDAGFSHIQYYYHEHAYGDLELRDLWEYELNLAPAEVEFIVAHAWEVLGKEYTYYFFRRNCAFRMAEVLELLPEFSIIPEHRPWTIPQALVLNVAASTRNDQPLVRSVTYHPSRQSTFNARFRELSTPQRRALAAFINLRGDKGIAAISSLPVEDQHAVLDALIDYLQFRLPENPSTDDPDAVAYRAVLAYRFTLPRSAERSPPLPDYDPSQERDPGYLSAAATYQSDLGAGLQLRWRAAYYDPLDTTPSQNPNSELTMGDVIVGVRDGDIDLQRAQLFRVESVNSGLSGLPGDRGKSWRLALGMQRQDIACGQCAVVRFEGDIGSSRWLSDSLIAGVYAGGAIQDNQNRNGNAFVRARVYANWHGPNGLRLRTTYEHRQHLDGRLEGQDLFSVEARAPLGRNFDVRLGITKNIETETMISFGRYW